MNRMFYSMSLPWQVVVYAQLLYLEFTGSLIVDIKVELAFWLGNAR